MDSLLSPIVLGIVIDGAVGGGASRRFVDCIVFVDDEMRKRIVIVVVRAMTLLQVVLDLLFLKIKGS